MNEKSASKDVDMTQGVIWKQLLWFALPLLIGNIFQQFYNTVDSIIVGNFVGKEALAAVGSVGPIINTLIGFFMGLSTGAGVVISQAYGGKQNKKVGKAVHTTLMMTLFLCVVLTVMGILMIPTMLNLMSTPEDIFNEAYCYLEIYFAGVTGLLIYNMGSGILRAVGNSKRPLYFLVFSTCVNTVLDIIFVAILKLGIAGAAWATVIAQGLSAVLVLWTLARTEGAYKLKLSALKIDVPILKEIIQIGFPTAIQQMITSVSNVFVQSYINLFGADVMAGWSTYTKIDAFMILPMQSVALAITTFVGQNYGAGKMERVKKGTTSALLVSIVVTLMIMLPIIIFAPNLVGLFNKDANVLGYGVLLLRMLSPFYPLCCVNQIYASTLRGLGDSKTPMIIMLGSFVVFRQIYLYVVSHLTDTILPIALGYPMGWLIASVLIYGYYKVRWNKILNEKNQNSVLHMA